jgi:2-methylcitrate dehydratase PrpD
MDASEDEMVAAFGIALSQASGVFEFLTNGSTVKSFHPGWAAHSGLVAASLAMSGLTGPETSFEGKLGLFARFAGNPEAAGSFAAEIATLGTTWHLRQAAFKFYPCCHYIHPFLTAMDALEATVPLADITELACFVPQGAAPIICDGWERRLAPQSGHEMRYSLPMVLALRAVDGCIDRAHFERPASAVASAFAKRIRWQPLPEDSFPDRFEAVIEAKLSDGTSRRIEIDDVRGGPRYPASMNDVLAKFRSNAAGSSDVAIETLIEVVMTIDKLQMPALADAIAGLET